MQVIPLQRVMMNKLQMKNLIWLSHSHCNNNKKMP